MEFSDYTIITFDDLRRLARALRAQSRDDELSSHFAHARFRADVIIDRLASSHPTVPTLQPPFSEASIL